MNPQRKKRAPSIKKATDSQLIAELNRRIQKTGVRFIIQLPASDRNEQGFTAKPDETLLFSCND